MDGGGGRGMKSKNVVEMNRYPHKQNCNISISMKLSTIDIILFFWVSDTFGGYVILLSSFVFYNARKCGISSFSLYSLDKDQIRQRSLNVTKNSGNFNICLKLTLTVVWVLLGTLGSF